MESKSASFIINTAADMREFGKKLGTRLFPRAFIALYGGLGAGKTTLVKGIAEPLGIEDISSPTFTIVRRHFGSLVLDHFDAYRIEDPDELTAIGYFDHLASESVIIMEWCENVPEVIPDERLEIRIEGSGEGPRAVAAEAFGSAYIEILEALTQC